VKLADAYVVRIYRRGRADAGNVSGVVETVCKGQLQAFSSFDELRAILTRRKRGGRSLPRKTVSADSDN
jgi:hypothetical protein